MKAKIYKLKRIMSALIIAALCMEMSVFVSYAAGTNETEESVEVEVLEAQIIEGAEWASGISPHTMLINCKVVVGRESDGMHIDITVGTTEKASVLGVKDIKIWKKNSKGKWDLVATSKGGASYNCSIGGVSITYANAVVGATYKISCVHYGDVDGWEEFASETSDFIYNFPIGSSQEN